MLGAPAAPALAQCRPLPCCGISAADPQWYPNTSASTVQHGGKKEQFLPLHSTKWPGGWALHLDLIRCNFFLEDKGWKGRSDHESEGLWFRQAQNVTQSEDSFEADGIENITVIAKCFFLLLPKTF